MKNSVFYAIYTYNQGLFISLFCENKDKPEMHCNGKFKLAEMRKEQKQKDSQNLLKQLQTDVLYYSSIKYPLSNNMKSCFTKVKQMKPYFLNYVTNL